MKLRILGILLFLGLIANCSSPTKGLLFTSTSQHISSGLNGSLINSGANIEKMGESCSQTFLIARFFFYGTGSSIELAAKAGGITKIAVIDRKSLNVLGDIYNKECIVVWGE